LVYEAEILILTARSQKLCDDVVQLYSHVVCERRNSRASRFRDCRRSPTWQIHYFAA
jgi:predicted transposase YdaD